MSQNFLSQLHQNIKKELDYHQIDTSIADEVATASIENLRSHWGGLSIYIPKLKLLSNKKRNQNIKEEFNGNNHQTLCKKYQISLQWLYKILKN